jgi:PAS domain S-box-containing protein
MEYSLRCGVKRSFFRMTVTKLEYGDAAVQVTHSDITAVKEAESRFGAIYNSNVLPMKVWQPDGRITEANEAYLQLVGCTREEMEAGELSSQTITPPEHARLSHAAIKRTRRPGSYALYEMEYLLKNGTKIPVLLCTCRLPNSSRERISFVIDLTLQKLAESSIRERDLALKNSTQRIRTLAGRLLTAQEEERRKIAGEMHDDVNSRLGMLAFELRQSFDGEPSLVTMKKHLRRLLAQVIELSGRVRNLSHELYSPVLEHAGVSPALQSLFAEAKTKLNITVAFKISGELTGIAREIGGCIYRVAQECLQNIAKHSGVKAADAELHGSPAQIAFRIADHGHGFDVHAPIKGLGLLSMKERVSLLGGDFRVQSAIGAGTEISVNIPLKTEPAML